MLTGRLIDERHSFLENVTHDGYLVQVGRIPDHLGKSRLEELLAIFEQKNLLEHGKMKKLDAIDFNDADAIAMANALSHIAAHEDIRKGLELELEFLTMDDMLYERDLAIAQKNEYLAKAEEVLAQKDEAIAQKDEYLAKAGEVLAQKDEELAKEREALALKDEALALKDEAIAQKDAALAAALAEIERLKGNY
jgi:hypothetical protein